MKTDLSSLNEYLFDQLNALSNKDLNEEELDTEIKRSKAITDVSGKIIENASLALKAAELQAEYGAAREFNFPMLENKK